ncbi:helix-turn-helix domain-containing protein [Novosphingobium sp.]|uniref:helix-turn-helix transcriptional regulator n=1 Tax=Novosphingobium sp. TaxID=1874826 RepID=UPI0025F3FE33|nr:helix-turn-helix domain-containing protein [Novosphingobium sp.]
MADGGQFLQSRNYPPSERLAPYIARHYVFSVTAPDEFELIDHLLSETAFVRLLLRGDWSAQVVNGVWSNVGQAVFFGPNSRPLPVRVRGGFRVVGIAFCPAGWRALSDIAANASTDRMVPLTDMLGRRATALLETVSAITDDSTQGDGQIVNALEAVVSELLDTRGWQKPDMVIQRFEQLARNNSTALVRDVAAQLGLSERQLERRCLPTFGMSPKAVLRRSRFLDMATAIRGLCTEDEREIAALRYYDQPQMIREFRRFTTMTPGQFEKTPTPLLTAGLELRNLRKMQDLANADDQALD